jgi:antitoxin VapB
MPVNIRDAEVDSGQAVGGAQPHDQDPGRKGRAATRVSGAQMKKSLWERIKPLRDEIAAYPDSGVILDKAFFDELSGEDGE